MLPHAEAERDSILFFRAIQAAKNCSAHGAVAHSAAEHLRFGVSRRHLCIP